MRCTTQRCHAAPIFIASGVALLVLIPVFFVASELAIALMLVVVLGGLLVVGLYSFLLWKGVIK